MGYTPSTLISNTTIIMDKKRVGEGREERRGEERRGDTHGGGSGDWPQSRVSTSNANSIGNTSTMEHEEEEKNKVFVLFDKVKIIFLI